MTENNNKMAVVGIGASAGGLTALKTFFTHVSGNPGAAFVVVMHLSPEHESHLADLLRSRCALPVEQVTRDTPLEVDRVYVIPPNANLESVDTHLRLSKLESERRNRAPIDHFFQTLAETHDGHAIGVLLSGTGSDGTLGLKKINECRGLTIAQSPDEAEYDAMPRNAIASGSVDEVLPLHLIPAAIERFTATVPKLPVADDGESLLEEGERHLRTIFSRLKTHTGHDFSTYKRPTQLRRIERRMQLLSIEELSEYADYLKGRREETLRLFDDLLITVTDFFRDREVFEYLSEHVLPDLFTDKKPDDHIRVWSIGCSTGEEAYSLAMLLVEEAEKREIRPRLQIFATDLQVKALATAREGVYPDTLSARLGDERLKRFFDRDNGSYRIKRDLREIVVFAEHNVLRDPPFSRLDLAVCRNMLIYLQRNLQREVMSILHYALKPGGRLLLGSSESVDASDLFTTENKACSLFRRRDVPAGGGHLTVYPFSPKHPPPRSNQPQVERHSRSYGSLHAELVEQYALPSVLISQNHDVVHSSAQAGRYLKMPGGEPTRNIFKLLDERLRIELHAILHAASEGADQSRSKEIPISFDGKPFMIVLRVRAAEEGPLKGYYLLMFEERPGDGGDVPAVPSTSSERELRMELDHANRRLQAVVEQYEGSEEEMRASNEELQSANEELRSTMEELETGKEELQSMNEELTTLNQENRHRVEELKRAKEYAEAIVETLTEPLVVLAPDLSIKTVNARFCEHFHLNREEITGCKFYALNNRQWDLPEFRTLLEEVLPENQSFYGYQVEVEFHSLGKRVLLMNARQLPSLRLILLSIQDITERDNAQQILARRTAKMEEQKLQLQHLAKELATAEHRERKRFAAMLHDELQQHLVAMKLHLGGARGENDNPEVAEYLDGAEDVLEMAIQSSRYLTRQLRPPVLYEAGLIPALRWQAEEMGNLHGITIHVESDIEELPLDDDMRAMVFECVRELLFNVVKHANVDEAHERIRFENRVLTVGITDHGIGFDAEIMRRNKVEGGGMGLFSIRERLKASGGILHVKSIPGDGTEIILEMPLVTENEHPFSANAAPADEESTPAVERKPEKVRVVVADDHAVVRQGLVTLIQRSPRIEVVGQAGDGEEVLKLVDQLRPDVVLMDINMPRKNGLEASKAIRKRWPHIQVIGLSVQDDEATVKSVKDAGAAMFLSKSDNANTMVRSILDLHDSASPT